MSIATHIIPAIMPFKEKDVRETAGAVVGLVEWVQVDIMDGQYVPSISWPFEKGDAREFSALAEGGDSFPFRESLHFEVDLMVAHPEDSMDDFFTFGARRMIVHAGCVGSSAQLRELLQGARNMYRKRKTEDGILGIALSMQDDVDSVNDVRDLIDYVQCMGIARIGYQGEPFQEETIERVRRLRMRYPDMPIQVDGGVSLRSAPRLIAAGATRLVAGSAIGGSTNKSKIISQFESLFL